MGCTSSVPNMADVQSDTAGDDRDIQDLKQPKKSNDDEPAQHDTLDDEETKNVLPTCDSLHDNIQLARNNNSINFAGQQVDYADVTNSPLEQPEISLTYTEQTTQNEHPNLKDVVEQVILDNIFQTVENISTLPDIETSSEQNEEETNIKTNKETSDSEKSNIKINNEKLINNDDSKEKEEDENIEESVSPSQSECSRATRWEALADIAAELPASLAVDPLTGQIYSLTK